MILEAVTASANFAQKKFKTDAPNEKKGEIRVP